jgi:very-short-patch-repair endonuclease
MIATSGEDAANRWVKLLQYYHACVAHESGFSELLQRAAGGGRYEFLQAGPEPLLSDHDGVIEVDASIRSLAGHASEHGESLFYGYPVLLFHEAGESGVRRKLAPLFVYELATPERGGPFPTVLHARTDEPFLHGAVLSRLGCRAEQQAALIESVAVQEWLGERVPAKEHINDLLATLGVPVLGTIDPSELTNPGEGQIEGIGAHNVAMVFRTTGAAYHGRLLEELKLLERMWPAARGTAASFLLGAPAQDFSGTADGTVGRRRKGAAQPSVELAIPIPLNDAQRATLRDAMSRPLTVVTGPPGTGKSQLVTSIIASAWLSGQSVLVASTNNQAVDVACERSTKIWPGLVVRTGAKAQREAAKELLLRQVDDRVGSADIGALRTCFDAARDRAATLLASADERTLQENRMVELTLGREKLAKSLGIGLKSFAAKFNDREVRSLDRALSRLVKRRVWFRTWRLGRLSRRLGTDLAFHLDEMCRLFELEHETREIHKTLGASRSFADIWPGLVVADRAFGAASEDLVRATARASFQRGSNAIRRFALARARYGSREGPAQLFPGALEHARAWASTALSVGASVPLQPALFDLVVIDEASQCSIPAILPLLFRARRAVVIGDPMQLAHIATVTRTDEEARLASAGLAPVDVYSSHLSYRRDSIFSALEQSAQRVRLLDVHYRSHPDIIEISNRLFYHGDLAVLTDPRHLRLGEMPALAWEDVRGRATRPAGGSAFNPVEVEAVVASVARLSHRQEFSGSVGVVTPFSAQARMIDEALKRAIPETDRVRLRIAVGTAHRFQGDERDVMVLSPVIAEGLPLTSIGWLVGTPNLFNVAITRARCSLVIVGDKAFCSGIEGVIGDVARYVTELGVRRDTEATSGRGDLHSEAESRLFEALSRRGLDVVPKMRVQGYEADFVIRAGKTLINLECDGRHHQDSRGRLRRQDRARDALIQTMGWRVLRVPAWRCLSDPESVVRELEQEIATAPSA